MCLRMSMVRLPSTTSSSEAYSSPKRSSSRLPARKLLPKQAGQASSEVATADIEDSSPRFSEKQATLIKANLLTWYDEHHRKLPWRHGLTQECPDSEELQQRRAYATWVSEVMLQQTRVVTVIDYFNRWMEKWPTVRDLAAATEEEVNSLWAGLGYYRRARFLLEGAKQLVASHEGSLPSSCEQLQKIRGIGKYTAGAIASIAFGQPVPVVDGNVIRVLCRLKVLSNDPSMSSTKRSLWSLAEQLVDEKRPGDLNQALMELGATICCPSSPLCTSCPLQGNCEGFSRYKETLESSNPVLVTDFPMKVVKPAPRQEYVAVCVLEKSIITAENKSNCKFDEIDSFLLLVRRPKTGLLAGLWEFPSASLDSHNPSLKECRSAINKYLEETLGVKLGKEFEFVNERKTVGTYKHVFSHIHMHMTIEWIHVHTCESDENLATDIKDLNGTEARWMTASALHDAGLTSGVQKVYQMFLDFRQGKGIIKSRGKRKRLDNK